MVDEPTVGMEPVTVDWEGRWVAREVEGARVTVAGWDMRMGEAADWWEEDMVGSEKGRAVKTQRTASTDSTDLIGGLRPRS
jgi:hypothetical protein